MDKEKDILVSGLTFLVALESFQQLQIMAQGKIIGVCSPLLRFANSLMAAVLIAATSLSVLISMWYFKKFSHEACKPFIEKENSKDEDSSEDKENE